MIYIPVALKSVPQSSSGIRFLTEQSRAAWDLTILQFLQGYYKERQENDRFPHYQWPDTYCSRELICFSHKGWKGEGNLLTFFRCQTFPHILFFIFNSLGLKVRLFSARNVLSVKEEAPQSRVSKRSYISLPVFLYSHWSNMHIHLE